MAVGLVVGIGFDPSPTDFQELLDRGLINRRDFQYVTLELSVDDAKDREQLRALFQAACAKQGWEEGFAMSNALKFAEVVVAGKPAVIVQPEGFEESEPDPGGIVAGIGFKPTAEQMHGFVGELGLRPGYRYVLHEYLPAEAQSEEFLVGDYVGTMKDRGWRDPKGDLSVHRVRLEGKDFVVVQPSAQ